jgi:hypothetical protein
MLWVLVFAIVDGEQLCMMHHFAATVVSAFLVSTVSVFVHNWIIYPHVDCSFVCMFPFQGPFVGVHVRSAIHLTSILEACQASQFSLGF